MSELLRAPLDTVEKRVQQLLDERRGLERKLEEAMRGGGDELQKLIAAAQPLGTDGATLVIGTVSAPDVKSLQAMGDALREQLRSGVGLLATHLDDGKGSVAGGGERRPAGARRPRRRDRARRGGAGWGARGRQAAHGPGGNPRCGPDGRGAGRGAAAGGRAGGGRMTVGEWLARRTPAPPPALRARVEHALAESAALDASAATDACLRAAERMVDELLGGNCTSRESALDLLTADALVTYAFEAASESPADLAARAGEAMRRIASLGAAPREGATA